MDPYKILGVGPDASAADIERAYRKQAAKYHPDAGGDTWAFQQVQLAYETIQLKRGNRPAAGARQRRAPVERAQSQTSSSEILPRSGETVAKQSATEKQTASDERRESTFRNLLFRQLPLQDETNIFILVSVLDIFMTYVLLRLGAMEGSLIASEANPIARVFFQRWNIDGLVFFKMGMVALVATTAQVIARYKLQTARRLLQFGTLLVAIVVAYSALLFVRHFS